MSRIDQLTADLYLLSEQDLTKVQELVDGLKTKLPSKKAKNEAYLKARQILKGIDLMSQQIINDRTDRI